MSESYHGTPITPDGLLEGLAVGTYCFCVSYWRPDQIALVCRIARKVMIDCGAFSIWMANRRALEKWIKGGRAGPEPVPVIVDATFRAAYYAWVREWLAVAPPGSWFVIFDEIDAGSQVQDALLNEVPADLLPYAWPVWHMDEPIERATRLLHRYGRCCVGSTGEFITVGSPDWRSRMDELFNAVTATWYGPGIPPLHMLRGLQCQKTGLRLSAGPDGFDQPGAEPQPHERGLAGVEAGPLSGRAGQVGATERPAHLAASPASICPTINAPTQPSGGSMTTTTPAEVREAVERVREIRQDLSAHLSQERPGDFVIRQHWVSEAEADITTLLAELARLTCAVGEVVELADAAEEFEESTERDRNNNRLLAAITRVRTAINPSKEDKADD